MLKKMKGKLSMKKLAFSILFISTLVLSAHLQNASASATPTPTYPYNLKWDIHNIYYYTDSDAQSKYGTPIQVTYESS